LKKWTADFVNDPNDDYNLIIEVLCDEEEIAIIRRKKDDLEMQWYANAEEIVIPVEWLAGLLIEATKRL
jgi:hypothetical protein